ncbi:hypothetical protein J2Z31_003467 [Sinorhizobium kostiense]|uniref:Uncharacterized protein n=1 Tax=Sinorhizobium kostiense TaxID=76747 RepID=A0ABS4R214_9HYPH|nr:hypothetical protein [Sinorhizobium kostiense]
MDELLMLSTWYPVPLFLRMSEEYANAELERWQRVKRLGRH